MSNALSPPNTDIDLPIAPSTDRLLDRLVLAMAHIKKAAQYCARLEKEAAHLENLGLERGRSHWNGRYLRLYYPCEGGKRKTRYVGCRAEAITEVRVRQARYLEWQEIQVSLLNLRSELAEVGELGERIMAIVEWY